MNIRTLTLTELIPAPYNPRVISEAALAGLTESIERFGNVQPIVWNERTGNVVSGHQRLRVLRELGVGETQVVVVDLPESEERALNITQNNPAITGEWAPELLAPILEELEELDPEGYEALRLGPLTELLPPPEIEPLEEEPYNTPADEAHARWNAKRGQVWVCGRHRVLCGDCTKTEDIGLLMGSGLASIVVTDPPYGVAIGAKNRLLQTVSKHGRSERDLNLDDATPDDLRRALVPAFYAAADDCTYFVFAPQGGELGMMMMAMAEAGLPVRHVLVWRKNAPTFSMGRLDYDYAHEPILLTWGKRHKRPMQGEQRTSVWEAPKPQSSKFHPTMKPVELYVNALLNNSDEGDILFDPFAGSGTALLAAEQTERRAYLMEIDPVFVSVILDRAAESGITPQLQSEPAS